MERRTLLTTLTALAAVACAPPVPDPASTTPPSPDQPPASPAPSGPPASPSAESAEPFTSVEVAEFDEPWAMAFLPDGRALITERGGRLRLVDVASGDAIGVAGTPEVAVAGQGGLGDVVLSPGFAEDRTVYLSWAERGSGGTGAAVGRARLGEGSRPALEGLRVIWRQEPKVSGNAHYSHRMAFSPDGRHLFVSSGERQRMDPAQDLSNTLGSIVRLTPDGRPAAGNPFADRGGAAAQIWSYGHRNVLGLAFDADGRLWSSEMGPKGGDEINLIREGANYGWPVASNGSHYGGEDIPDHRAGDGFEAPKVWWNPSISPSSLLVYSGALFPQWRGDAFVGALSGEALIRVRLEGANAEKGEQWGLGARIRAVTQGPDGALWLLTDGGGGRLLKLTPPN